MSSLGVIILTPVNHYILSFETPTSSNLSGSSYGRHATPFRKGHSIVNLELSTPQSPSFPFYHEVHHLDRVCSVPPSWTIWTHRLRIPCSCPFRSYPVFLLLTVRVHKPVPLGSTSYPPPRTEPGLHTSPRYLLRLTSPSQSPSTSQQSLYRPVSPTPLPLVADSRGSSSHPSGLSGSVCTVLPRPSLTSSPNPESGLLLSPTPRPPKDTT